MTLHPSDIDSLEDLKEKNPDLYEFLRGSGGVQGVRVLHPERKELKRYAMGSARQQRAIGRCK